MLTVTYVSSFIDLRSLSHTKQKIIWYGHALICIHNKQKDLKKVPFQNEKICQANGFIEIIGTQTFCINLCIKNS